MDVRGYERSAAPLPCAGCAARVELRFRIDRVLLCARCVGQRLSPRQRSAWMRSVDYRSEALGELVPGRDAPESDDPDETGPAVPGKARSRQGGRKRVRRAVSVTAAP